MLLLDEPMAGMSAQESADVIALLHRLKQHYAIFLVEHDMDAVFALADRVSVLVYGKLLFTGTPEDLATAVGPAKDFEAAFVSFLSERAH